MECVAFRVVEINQPHDVGAIFLVVEPTYLNAALKHVHEDFVLSDEGTTLDISKFGDGTIYRTTVDAGIDSLERWADDVRQESIVEGARTAWHVGTV